MTANDSQIDPAPSRREERDRLTVAIIEAKGLLGPRANGSGWLFRGLQFAIDAAGHRSSLAGFTDDELQRAAKVAELIAEAHAAGVASVRKVKKPEAPTDVAPAALAEQIGGTHYKQFSVQPSEIAERNNLTFLEGSAIKRLHRHSRGGKGLEDLRKAIHEIRQLAAIHYNEEI